MNIEVKEINSSEELLTKDAAEWWYHSKTTYLQTITESQTFYIYRFFEDKIILFITDGLKTDPPLSPTIYKYDRERYEKVFTIPKGIIHAHHCDYIDPNDLDHYKHALNSGIFISTTRNDEVAKEKYKEYVLERIRYFKSLRREASRSYYANNKEVKKYESLINDIK